MARFSAVKILLGGCLAGPGGCNQSYCHVCCFAGVFPNENHCCGLSLLSNSHACFIACLLFETNPTVGVVY